MKRILSTLLGALAAGSALNLQPSTALAQVTVFTNPTPAFQGVFGWSVAAVGNDRVLIGAPGNYLGASGAGKAYLFSTDGALLTTFAKPAPAAYDNFGDSVVAVGPDRVLIAASRDDTGASVAGAAYLFSTNGALLTTITNPAPAVGDLFGSSVAVVGSDRVLIGAYGDSAGGTYAGAAYLFSTNGALLTTFTRPTPADYADFGRSVAAVGTDRVLIGAEGDSTGARAAGAAYLFTTSGAWLTTFTNPTPADYDYFGYSVAAVGSDRVLIGAWGDSTQAAKAGAAYLFSTNGTLLITITNPTPAVDEEFGASVAAMGADRMLIGAPRHSAGSNAVGAAYLFSAAGALLATTTNPVPAAGERFGSPVTAVGTDHVLIAAPYNNTGALTAGAAYLFSVETPPQLSISFNRQLSTVTVSWPASAAGWVLECTNALPSAAAPSWPQVPPPYRTNAGTISVACTNNPATGNQFFRLHKP